VKCDFTPTTYGPIRIRQLDGLIGIVPDAAAPRHQLYFSSIRFSGGLDSPRAKIFTDQEQQSEDQQDLDQAPDHMIQKVESDRPRCQVFSAKAFIVFPPLFVFCRFFRYKEWQLNERLSVPPLVLINGSTRSSFSYAPCKN